MRATRTCGAFLTENWRLKLKKDLSRWASASASSSAQFLRGSAKFELRLKLKLKNVVLGWCPSLSKSNLESASTWNLFGTVHSIKLDSSSTWSRSWSWKKRVTQTSPNAETAAHTELRKHVYEHNCFLDPIHKANKDVMYETPSWCTNSKGGNSLTSKSSMKHKLCQEIYYGM